MRIDLEVLKKEPLKPFNYEFSEDVYESDWLLCTDLKGGKNKVHIKMTAYFSDGIIFIKGVQNVSYRVFCDRCAEFYEASYSGSFSEEIKLSDFATFVTERDGETVKVSINNENESVFNIKGGFLGLREYFRQMFLASHGLKSLCSESCQGLCPDCGVNRNIEQCSCSNKKTDIRFAVLKDLQKKLK